MYRAFRIVRVLATGLLTFAVLYGIVVSALADKPAGVWTALGLVIVCLFVICYLWELDG